MDYLVIGGGIFGAYAALFLAEQGKEVLLVEKEKELFKKASVVNQARLHGGYHYPRSVATARMSDENRARFTHDHKAFINTAYQKYYAIDRFGSFTDGAQFQRFCDFLEVKCSPIKKHALFNFERIEALFETVEYSFDPILMAAYYRQKLEAHPRISIRCFSKITQAYAQNSTWHIELQNIDNQHTTKHQIHKVINATYSGSNGIHQLFGVNEIKLQHEIAEMAFVTSPALKDIGLTVMDGQFGSMMPYGKSGLLSLSSVAYTHHKVSYNNLPTFDCQQRNTACTPDFPSICNACSEKPPTNARKMIAQISRYFQDDIQLSYYFSQYTIKSKLRANHIDDGRPTEIAHLHKSPDFYCIFAGKINSIYEIEKMVGK